jgi:basic membrane protein A
MKKSIIILLYVLICVLSLTSIVSAADVKRVAVVLDPVGVNPFLTQVVDKLA